jgi:hypothetical protein
VHQTVLAYGVLPTFTLPHHIDRLGHTKAARKLKMLAFYRKMQALSSFGVPASNIPSFFF